MTLEADDKNVWLDLSGVVDMPLHKDEVAALFSMFDTAGWKTFMKIRRMEADASASAALGLGTPEESRVMNRALYHGMVNDLTFEQRLVEAAEGTVPVREDELVMVDHIPPPLPSTAKR